YQLDSGIIKTVFHPHSNRPELVQHLPEFQSLSPEDNKPPTPSDFRPWRPFQTRLDYEVSEFSLRAGLNENLTKELIDLLLKCSSQPQDLTIRTPAEIQKLWDLASPELAPELQWDACRHYKSNNGSDTWEHFLQEPWSANSWWRIQSELPTETKPFFIILYADKSKLSSFGTEKGYPVIAWCANLPTHIRNGSGAGGGRVVGWLPVVEGDSAESGKAGFANFKAAVWHEAFSKILDSIVLHSQTGCLVDCGDKIQRHLCPIPYILSADFEEQCIMALIRGFRGLCPCPKCLISSEKLSDLSLHHEPRTPAHTVQILNKAKLLHRKADQDELLKSYGLRPYPNVFFKVAHADPYFGCSFDELHFGGSGLWADHIFEQFKSHLKELRGRDAAVEIDKKFDEMPPWRGLNHFSTITNMTFNDGSKHHDISKIFLFAAYDAFGDHRAAFQLLRCLRAYLNMTMYGNLQLQTEATMHVGEEAVLKFSALISKYKSLCPDKSWNFPKMHYHSHWFEDIKEKGVSLNYSTKPNEKMHGPLRKIYHGRTNFKNVSEQILWVEHQFMVSTVIRSQIDILDDYTAGMLEDELQSAVAVQSSGSGKASFYLGSCQPPMNFSDLENLHQQNNLFSRFRIRLGEFLNNHFLIDHPDLRRIQLDANDFVSISL
ncbi:hypothetical protein K435DRAFT_695754, partial [Dendrothele bispora CBS 962.96]